MIEPDRLVALVMGWFAVGSIWNVRKGKRHPALDAGRAAAAGRAHDRAMARDDLRRDGHGRRRSPPSRRSTLVIFLEPRDVPWIWALSRRRGRRDTLIVRGQPRAPPPDDIEALDRTSWSGRDALAAHGVRAVAGARAGAPGAHLRSFYQVRRTPWPLGDALLELARGAGHHGAAPVGPAGRAPSSAPRGPARRRRRPRPEFFRTLRAVGERRACPPRRAAGAGCRRGGLRAVASDRPSARPSR